MPGFDVQFKFRPNPAAMAKLNGALFRALDETLDIDIKTEAKERSPYKFGHNMRSIGIEVEEVGDDGGEDGHRHRRLDDDHPP